MVFSMLSLKWAASVPVWLEALSRWRWIHPLVKRALGFCWLFPTEGKTSVVYAQKLILCKGPLNGYCDHFIYSTFTLLCKWIWQQYCIASDMATVLHNLGVWCRVQCEWFLRISGRRRSLVILGQIFNNKVDGIHSHCCAAQRSKHAAGYLCYHQSGNLPISNLRKMLLLSRLLMSHYKYCVAMPPHLIWPPNFWTVLNSIRSSRHRSVEAKTNCPWGFKIV